MSVDISDRPMAGLVFTFADPFVPMLFDDETVHGMHHRMKKVDFIVNGPGETWLVEVKDPEFGTIPMARRASERESFRKKMRSGTLYRLELAPKLKDSLIYLTLSNNAPAGKILYIAVIGLTRMDARTLLTAQKKMRELCYYPGPHRKDWPSKFDVIIVNLATWNKLFAPHSVRRKSESNV